MARRTAARYFALVGFVIALFAVVGSSGSDGGSSETGAKPAATATATPAKKGKQRKPRRTYTVKPGDTPSSIAEKMNVPLSQIQALNPDLDDQTLSVGQRIKLRR